MINAVERGPETPSERVEAELRALLAGMTSGQALPPVRELAERYGVSTARVSKALARLARVGQGSLAARVGDVQALTGRSKNRANSAADLRPGRAGCACEWCRSHKIG